MSGYNLEQTTTYESITDPKRALTDVIFGSFSAVLVLLYILYSNRDEFNNMTTVNIIMSLILLVGMFLIARIIADFILLVFVNNFEPSLKLGNSLAEWIIAFIILYAGIGADYTIFNFLPTIDFYHSIPILGTYVLYFLYSSNVIKI